MIKDLVKDDAILSQPCDAVAVEEAAALAANLTDTLESLENVACLHANQLGVTKAAFIYLDTDDKPHIMFNAKMIRALGAFKTTEDGSFRAIEAANAFMSSDLPERRIPVITFMSLVPSRAQSRSMYVLRSTQAIIRSFSVSKLE